MKIMLRPTQGENAAPVEEAAEQVTVLMDRAKDLAIEHGPSLIAAAAILFIGWILAKMVRGVVRKILKRAKVDETLVGFLCNLTYMTLLAFVFIAAVSKLGVETASFVAILGAGAFAIGFALQGSLANFAAGVMLMIFRPFKVGDWVEAGGASGAVEQVGIFATVFKTGDNKQIIVANSAITGGNITNYSAKDTRRVDMVFGIGYGDDIKQAKKILKDILDKDDRVLKDPAPTIALSELADSSVNFVCRPWVKSGDYWAVLFDTNEAVKLAFDAAGVSIPFPQQDVHMHQVA